MNTLTREAPSTRRQEIITELLTHYQDLIAPTTGGPGDGTGTIQTPPTYTKTVRLLEHALREMRLVACWNWWHINERYIRSERSIKTLGRINGHWINLAPNQAIVSQPGGWTLALTDQRKPKNANGTPRPEFIPVTICTWNPQVRQENLNSGIAWIARQFDHYGCEPYVPPQLHEIAA